jgi:hypothetical protein
MQKRVPVRFSYESGNGHFDEDTGWLTLVPYWSQFHGYLRASSIPYGFTAGAYLVYAFNPAEIYPATCSPACLAGTDGRRRHHGTLFRLRV